MKHIWKSAAAAALTLMSWGLQAEVTGNIGWMSDYVFRGLPLASSSANLGVDWNQDDGGLYVGTWAANLDEGIEVDVYGGYSGSLNELDYTIGATVYVFTDAFDENAYELNLAGSWKFLTLEANFGQYDSSPSQDYNFLAATLEHNGFYAKVGSFGNDFDGDYFEAGYNTEFKGLDVGAYYVYSNSDLIQFFGGGNGSDTNIALTISKTFSFSQVIDAFNGKKEGTQ